MFTIHFHRQSLLFQDILILQDSTADVQAANLSFQARQGETLSYILQNLELSLSM